MNEHTAAFLKNHGLAPELIHPAKLAPIVEKHMREGLRSVDDIPMIPCYISGTGSIQPGESAIVIDAGGTNYRRALATYTGSSFKITDLQVDRMPGTGNPATWEQFIKFVADSIEPLCDKTDKIGFTFSYSATIMPNGDGIVDTIDKEVIVIGCEGKAIGASLLEELENRGITGKKVIILNDTVSAMLGGSSELNMSQYDGLIGMICGTGFNTCCEVDCSLIEKIESNGVKSMIVNHEAGCFNEMPGGDIDAKLDAASTHPGEKLTEKKTSGVYLGTICRYAMEAAAEERLISEETWTRIQEIERLDGSVVDAWSVGKDKFETFANEEEKTFAQDLCTAIFQRSARNVCSVLLGEAMLIGCGKTKERPLCVCAEGSLIAKSKDFLPYLQEMLKKYGEEQLGIYIAIVVGHETTLPGSAVAAILNS